MIISLIKKGADLVRSWKLHHNNVWPYVTNTVCEFLDQKFVQAIPHLPYILDLAPNDFFFLAYRYRGGERTAFSDCNSGCKGFRGECEEIISWRQCGQLGLQSATWATRKSVWLLKKQCWLLPKNSATFYQTPKNWATFHRALQFERMLLDACEGCQNEIHIFDICQNWKNY